MTTRFQTGTVFESYKAFRVKFYQTEMRNGEPVRVHKTHKLCKKDATHYSTTCKAVKKLAHDFMVGINAKDGTVENTESITVAEFFESRFIPYCEEILPRKGRPRRRANTVDNLRWYWRRHLKDHFAAITLADYEAAHGNRFLRTLTSTQGKTTIKHIRSLGSSIFKLAVRDELIKTNPWREVEIPDDAEEGDPTEHYTVSESEDIISALVDHVDCQLIMALACFMGLRPGEIAALKWSDIEGDWLHVQRSVSNGYVDRPKTRESIAKLPIVGAVRVPLELWRQKAPQSANGWVFPSRNDTPIDLHNLQPRVLRPHVQGPEFKIDGESQSCIRCENVPESSGVKWKGIYSGRRGAATNVIELTNDFALAQQLLRHKSAKTTLDFYKKLMTPKTFKERMEQAFPASKQLQS
jgi:integrase